MSSEDAAGAYPSRASAHVALLVLVTLYFFVALDSALAGLLLEPMKHDLGLSDVQVGFAHATTMSLAYGLSSIPMGMLADRLNRVRLLIGAVMLWTGAMIMAGMAPSILWLVVSRVGLGVATATVYPAAMSLLADNFPPDRRAFATGAFAASRVVGSAAALLVGGLVYGLFAKLAAADPATLFHLSPWRALFILFAVAGTLLLPAIAMLREPWRQEVGRVEGGTFADLWSYRAFLIPLLLGLMFLSCAVATSATWTPPLLMRRYGQQPADLGLWLGPLALLAGLVGVLGGARLSSLSLARRGRTGMLAPAIWGSAIAGPACLFSIMPGLPGFAALYALFTIVSGGVIVVSVVAINIRMPNELRGLALALEIVAVASAGALAPAMAALIGRHLGGDAMLGEAMALVGLPSCLLAATCFALAVRLDRKGRAGI